MNFAGSVNCICWASTMPFSCAVPSLANVADVMGFIYAGMSSVNFSPTKYINLNVCILVVAYKNSFKEQKTYTT